MFYDKLLNKREYADKYFDALHSSGNLVTPPYTYSYILAHDSIKAVEKNGRTGFMIYPFKHFILPTYTEKEGFDNHDCIFSQPHSLSKLQKKHTNTQFILHRDYTLKHYRKLGEELHGKGRPVLFNKNELKWYLNNKRVLNYDDCLFQNNGGQHFYLYEIDGMKLLIIWDDYYSSCINIIAVSQLIDQHIQHKKFEHPYTVLCVYISAFCSFFRMFPCGTLFNTTIESVRGTINNDNNIYIPLNPIACYDIYTTIKDEIKEKVRIYTKYPQSKWRNNLHKKASKDSYNIEKDLKIRKPIKRKKIKKLKRKVRKKRGKLSRRTKNLHRMQHLYETGKVKKRHIRKSPRIKKEKTEISL